jgi:hypothetical protein
VNAPVEERSAGPLAALLAGVVDYAGLFPPASLSMNDAVARYATYASGPHRSILGRFVLPVARLGEFRRAAGSRNVDGDGERPAGGLAAWRLAVLAVPDDAPEIVRFNAAYHGRFLIDTVEAKASDVEAIWRLASAFDESMMVYVELPVRPDPAVLIAELGARGLRAKIRTGGVTPDDFPTPVEVLRFLSACARNGVPFKATAGLHHPLRGEYALTYDDDAARGTMYGFLNVFVAAALLYDGVDEVDLVPLLEERDRSAFRLTGDSITWRGRSVNIDEIARARAGFATSFGSCSFEEPVRDLEAMHLLPSR